MPLRAAPLLLLLASCQQLVQYSDELTEARSGRSLFVRAPATLGGTAGFVAGIPVDIAALPVTYGIYTYRDAATGGRADPLSILLFPSFVLWKAGAMVAVPFDMLEFVGWRVWQPPDALDRRERELVEWRWDQEALPVYAVTPVHPEPDREP